MLLQPADPRSTSAVINHVNSINAFQDKNSFLPVILLPPKSITLVQSQEKYQTNLTERYEKKYFTSIPQECQDYQKQGKFQKLS